ncbi:DNA polymerase III subunit delta' [Vibrio zhugei]|uniref:DNA polymerase III subunit delta' n=1 Tax=Vibrio zhugei TaxID=2479546 RepID=A0ABV7C4E7_9VIBR|nr:DNA polymerase III subunit delta' [Vibrio zhugei]
MAMHAPWLDAAWHDWQTRLKNNTFSHATLVHSQQDLGIYSLAEQFGQALMCTTSDSEPCGFCHGCSLMQSGNHPDYHVVRPEKEGKSITVEQIRACNRWAQASSQMSGYRLIIIEPADAMNESAANALLKTLEEPSSHCVFVLLTQHINHLLPTIISRCQVLAIAEPTAQVISQWLEQQIQQPIPDYAAHLNGNSPLQTQSFIESKGIEEYANIEAAFLRAANGDISAATECTRLLTASPRERLQWLWFLISDAQKVHFGIKQRECVPGATQLAEVLSYERLYRCGQDIIKLNEQLREFTGLNSELLIMDWLMNINEDTCL